jgi:hypothetical protein
MLEHTGKWLPMSKRLLAPNWHPVSKWLLASVVGLLLGGCASTKLVNVWQNPKFSGPQLHAILIIGVTKQAGIRRTFEDEFVRQLEAQGVRAVASYTLIPEDGEVPKDRLSQAVKEAGVEGVLITRLVKVERQTQVYPGSFAGPPYMGFYGFYSSAWIGYYDPPQVYTYEVVTSETNLFDSRNETLIWSGTSETFSPRDVKKDTQDFASVIIKALGGSKLI